MKIFAIILSLVLPILAFAENGEKQSELDSKSVSSLGTKMFDFGKVGGKDFAAQKSSFGDKRFSVKESKMFSQRNADAFDKVIPRKMASMDKEFTTNEFGGWKQRKSTLSAQQRFDALQDSSTIKRTLMSGTDKASQLDGKRYLGPEAKIIKQHLHELQQKDFDKLDLDEKDLNVEQIREMLNKQ